jgi:hypothetical protein
MHVVIPRKKIGKYNIKSSQTQNSILEQNSKNINLKEDRNGSRVKFKKTVNY